MAKVSGPAISIKASGLIGERLVFSQRKSGQQARIQKAQIYTPNFTQSRNRDVYKDAVDEWNLLSTAEKDVWKGLAVGQHLTGYNLFMQDYYMNTIRKLATVENIDFKALGDTLIYIVPTGMRFVPTALVVRVKSSDAPNADGAAVLKRTSDNITLHTFSSSELGVVDYFTQYAITVIGVVGVPFVSAGDSLKIEITGADTGTALTFDVDLIGYLIET